MRAMPLTDRERDVVAEIESRRDELGRFTSDLIAFDTTAREIGDPPREEARLQAYLAERLGAAGADIDLFEPDAETMAGKPLVPPGLDFAGRPQLIARFRGAGGGPSLVFNGHIDAVSYEPVDRWTSHPLRAEVRDGRLYGRGSCDMKGGVAAMALAADVLAAKGVRLAGDLVVATNTDEESSGAGGSALVERGLRADAGIVTEATGFDVWVACRGSEYCEVVVAGRPGHAEVRQAHWRNGGAVNAIEKAMVVVDAIQRLREEWRGRLDLTHPYLSAPDVVPTKIRAGEWAVTHPAECRIVVACMFLPQQADGDGWGKGGFRREVEEWVARAAAADPWLAENPPRFEWWPNGVMSMGIPEDDPIVEVMQGATADVGRPGVLSGLDSWYDGATFTRLAGTPSIGFGPSGFDPNGRDIAHTIDEYVPVDDLVHTAQALAVAAMRFCKEV
jgi:acetylornithine deacetylase